MEVLWGWLSWPGGWAVTLLVVDNLIRIVSLFVVPRNRRPTAGMAWLMVIFLLPIPALLLFLLIGTNRLPRRLRRRHERVNARVTELADRSESLVGTPLSLMPAGLRSAVMLARSLGAQPMLIGNTAELYHDYAGSLRHMTEAIRSAKDYVYVQFYILVHDHTTNDLMMAMREARERGVEVRVLLDHISSMRNPGMRRTARFLTESGIQWHYMLPVRPWRGQWQRPDLRNHRKILVVDGRVGFMGSQNLVDASYNKKRNRRRGLQWKDVMVRVEGPAVRGLEAVFLGDWYLETGETVGELDTMPFDGNWPGTLDCQVLPSGPGFASENNLQVFVSLFYTATKRISITSPYFVPDGAIMHALRAAIARGVDVELFVSEIGDQPLVYHAQRSYYEELLRAGVRIFMFRPPYILHSKHFTVDDEVAVIGSSNMDQRSFNLNMEVSMIIYGATFVEDLDEINAYYHSNSRELTMSEWSKQPLRSQLLDGLARLTSALQ